MKISKATQKTYEKADTKKHYQSGGRTQATEDRLRPTAFHSGSDSKDRSGSSRAARKKVDSHDPEHGDWVWNVFYINIGK